MNSIPQTKTKRKMPTKWHESMNTPSEKKRRSEMMKLMNSSREWDKTCIVCNEKYKGQLHQTICSKECKLNSILMRKYGIDSEWREKTRIRQKDRCALCLKEKKLVIDHCHRTGKARGLLCRVCNTSLKFFDDKELLARTLKYTNSI